MTKDMITKEQASGLAVRYAAFNVACDAAKRDDRWSDWNSVIVWAGALRRIQIETDMEMVPERVLSNMEKVARNRTQELSEVVLDETAA